MSILASESFLTEFESRRPWSSFAAGYALETVLALAVVQVALLTPVSLMAPPHKNFEAIALATTPPADAPRATVIKVTAPRVLPQAMPLPRVEVARVETAPVPPPLSPKTMPMPVTNAPVIPAAPKPAVAVGTFETSKPSTPRGNPAMKIETAGFSGSSATPTVSAPARAVQTGGFGDPNGVAGVSDKPGLHAAAVGSFDLPAGGGVGNGRGGTRGIRGVVASSGFGDGIAGSGSGDRGGTLRGGGSVSEAGFSAAQPAARPSTPRRETAEEQATPVQILSKPAPIYTEEARRLKIEGEVVLRIVFGADGTIRDISVVRGLGHGLDEAAVVAARKIHFQPAHRGAQPVDYSATVHVVFQLA